MYKKTIANIFSQKPEKILKNNNHNSDKPQVIADYREKNSLVAAELRHLGCNLEFKELKVADYLTRNVAIERKTISDFINSMINKRLLRQVEELQQYENRLLIIEGIEEQELYSDDNLGVHSNAIRGFMLTISIKYKVPIILSKNYKDTAKFIYLIAKKQEKEMSIRPTKKSLNKKQQAQFILEGFPGIGPKTSKKLLKEFKSIKTIINTPIENLQSLIGKKAESFKTIIDSEFK